jgi:hypothetical protein
VVDWVYFFKIFIFYIYSEIKYYRAAGWSLVLGAYRHFLVVYFLFVCLVVGVSLCVTILFFLGYEI